VRGTVSLVGGLAVALALLIGAEGAGAATLKASYPLQGDLASEIAGAPELSSLGTGNRFVFETVDGTRRPVLVFPRGGGLSLNTTGLVDPQSHSVAMLFRLADVSRYRRLLDFANGTSDNGLYNLTGRVALYQRDVAVSQSAVFGHSYVQLVLTNEAVAADAQETTVYVNGVEVVAARTSEGFELSSGVLRFFQDNTSGGGQGENSPGAVACVLVYDGALTAAEVSQVAGAHSSCPAPRSTPGRAKVLKADKPEARRSGRSIAVDTGLVASCPVGTTSCVATGRVEAAARRKRGRAATIRRLGAVKFSLPGGASKRVVVRLSERGARALREAGKLRIRAFAEVFVAPGRRAGGQQVGRIEAPRSSAFRTGVYSGTTSQGLPIVVSVGRRAIRSVYFRWRVQCADGQVHTNAITVPGERVSRGRFFFFRVLDTGGSVRVAGRIRGVHAAGTLSRVGESAFGTRCRAKGIRWHARAAGIEVGSDP
jgi:hypothetical protein